MQNPPALSRSSLLAPFGLHSRPWEESTAHLVPVPRALLPLFPGGGMRRGSVICVASAPGAGGGTTLALSLIAGISAAGLWSAVVGLDDLGAVAARDLGADLERLAIVITPGACWPEVTAELLSGMDAVLLRPLGTTRANLAGRLAAQARKSRSILVVLAGEKGGPQSPHMPLAGARHGRCKWPSEATALELMVARSCWEGLEDGHGYLSQRRVEVISTGRGAGSKGARQLLWMPSSRGSVEPITPAGSPDKDSYHRGATT